MMLLSALGVTRQAVAQPSSAFIHVADTGNINLNYSVADHAGLNDSALKTPIFMHRYNVGNDYIAYLNKKLGAWYIMGSGRWSVFTQDKSAFKENTAFNVLVPGDDMNTFVHKSDANNTAFDYTTIDNPLINNNPNAVFLVNDLYKSKYNLKITGVYYNQSSQRWRIFNMDGSDMEENLSFSIVVSKNGMPYGAAFHTATAQNIIDNRTALDIPAINNNPDALVFVSQVWKAGGAKNNNHVGVYYALGKWYVYNETDGIPTGYDMPENAAFHVVYFLNKPTGISQTSKQSPVMNVFPNPVLSGEALNLTLDATLSPAVRITLCSVDGRTVMQQTTEEHHAGITYTFSTADLAPGIYTLFIESGGQTGVQKVMIK